MPTACIGYLRRWPHFDSLEATWLRTYSQKTDMLFICVEEKAIYEFRLARILIRYRHSTLSCNKLRELVLPYTDFCCFGNLSPTARFLTRYEHFRMLLDFEQRFWSRTSSSPIFFSWHYAEAFLISCQSREQSRVHVVRFGNASRITCTNPPCIFLLLQLVGWGELPSFYLYACSK